MKHLIMASTFATLGIAICTYAAGAQTGPTDMQVKTPQGNYVPGMGEIMGATQIRHSKLWFAGIASNWDLASYELDEIREGLADAAKYYPVFKKDAPVASMLAKFTDQPLTGIESAIKAKDGVKFKKSFDNLTSACNDCHHAASVGFVVIKRPGVSPSSNQEFAVKPK